VILQALAKYYDRLAEDPEQDVAPFGFSRQKIGFCVVLEEDGRLHDIETCGTVEDGRSRPEPLVVPGQSKPSGSGINACFLWDNTAYMLGHKKDDPKPKRTAQCFDAFRQKHIEAAKSIDDPALHAVATFLKQWNPASAESYDAVQTMNQYFGVFRLRGQAQYVHQRPAALQHWQEQIAAADNENTSRCLVTGEHAPIARIQEPKIKGVAGGAQSAALLVSFNEYAYLSYGQEKNYTVPISEIAAFQYATALNRLLADRHRRTRIGDATVIYWTDAPTQAETFFGPAIGASQAEDQQLADTVRAFLLRLSKGKAAVDELGNPKTPFYVLGLSPNASRLSVRFWLASTIGELYEKLARHVADLEMAASPRDRLPTMRELLLETAREPKEIPPLLGGALMRAILTGGPYPEAFYIAVLRRIRADRRITYRRAAILKACLLRKYRNRPNPKEVPVSLDTTRTDIGYRLGRWFAVLEKVQEEASRNGLNATIRDRFFSSAMAAPASAFPRLIRLHQHHLGKIENIGRRKNLEILVQEVAEDVQTFPPHLNLDDQGLFAIGYYHQRQSLFTKRDQNGHGPASDSDTVSASSNDKD